MRGFKDHRKLTMVRFRFNRSHCLFGVYGTCSGVPREDLESWIWKCPVSRLDFGNGVTVSAGQCRGKTRIQAPLGLDSETGRWQNPRGECFHKGTKEPKAEERWGTQSLWDFWDKGCPRSTERVEDSGGMRVGKRRG